MTLPSQCLQPLRWRPGTAGGRGPADRRLRRCVPRAAAASDAAHAKRDLQQAVAHSDRGGSVTRERRGVIEEAQVALERCGGQVDYDLLPGSWRLIYTTAPDVAPLLATSSRIPFAPRVGGIYQRFSSVAEGKVENVIEASIPLFLRQGDGVTVKVLADYEVRSPNRISLTFRRAGFGDIRISSELETLLAPALLPRSWLNHQALLALQEFQVSVPLRSNVPVLRNAAQRAARSVGSEYLLSFLDEEMLVGRQTGPGGSFVFVRDVSG